MNFFKFLTKKTKKEEKIQFLGFVLLNESNWDKEKFKKDLNEDWNITLKKEIEEPADYKAPICASYNDLSVLASIIESPIPNQEVEINAEFNHTWKDAVKITKNHKAHIMLSVSGPRTKYKELSILLVKLISSCLKQNNAIAVYQYSNVYEPKVYQEAAKITKDNILPIYNLIWLGVEKTSKLTVFYTNGMRQFNKEEIEICVDNDKFNMAEIQGFLVNIVSYVLEGDITLKDGETIGLTAEQKLKITYSKGIVLPANTLKIEYK